MPNRPVSQHQKTAPGPPIAMAVDTPTIFPVPIVAAKVAVRAANPLKSPSAPFSGSPKDELHDQYVFGHLLNEMRNRYVFQKV